MSSINFFGSNLLKAYIGFQSNSSDLDSDDINKMQEEMGMDDDADATPKQRVEKYIVEQSTNISEEVKRQIAEMKKQQAEMLALAQAGAGEKFQTELDQKNELVANREQNESDFLNKITKHDLTKVLKQVLSDDSENADDSNIDLVATLTNMIAEKNSTMTVATEA